MQDRRIGGKLALFLLGFCLAACYQRIMRPAGRAAGAAPSAVDGPGAAPERSAPDNLARLVDWSEWNGDFRIHNPRVILRSDRSIAPRPFPVIAFEIEALQEFAGLIYQARFYDAEGVEIPMPLNLVMLDPDYAVTPPFRWKPGVRSHGWFLIPDDDVARRTRRVAIAVYRGL